MSWFTSLFTSGIPVPTLRDPPTSEKRLLEETPPSPAKTGPSARQLSLKTDGSTQQSWQSDPRNRNKIIFGAGLAFFGLSMLISRRAFVRRRLASNPAFYTNAPGHHAEQAKKASPAMEAFEALNIATVNVLSLTMLASGGTLWYFDINTMAEARKFIRGGLGVDGTGKSETQAEEEFEEWMATTLARKDAKDSKHKTVNSAGD